MNILVINSGSATLKLDLMQVESPGVSPHRVARGRVERFAPEAATDFQLGDGEHLCRMKNVPDHQAGVSWFLSNLGDAFGATPQPIAAVVHRIVHGGATFTAPTLLDEGVVAELEALNELAPLHNPPAVALEKTSHSSGSASVKVWTGADWRSTRRGMSPPSAWQPASAVTTPAFKRGSCPWTKPRSWRKPPPNV